jgi:hypothetical protein
VFGPLCRVANPDFDFSTDRKRTRHLCAIDSPPKNFAGKDPADGSVGSFSEDQTSLRMTIRMAWLS